MRIQSLSRGRMARSQSRVGAGAVKGVGAHTARLQKQREKDAQLYAAAEGGHKKKVAKKVEPTGSEEEEAAARKVQASIRGSQQRNTLAESEEALEIHLEALSSAEEAERYAEYHTLEQLVGKDEEREYLRELDRKKLFITRKIAELERGKYYKKSSEQRQVFREIRLLNEQLAATVNELRLIKSGSIATAQRKASVTSSSSSRPSSGRPGFSRQATGGRRKSALPMLSAMAKLESGQQGPTVRVRFGVVGGESRVEREGGFQWDLGPPTGDSRVHAVVEMSVIDEAAERAKDLEEKAKQQAKERTQQAALAKLSPLGHESAVRKALLQGELMKLNPVDAVDQIRTLRKNMESLELQIRMSRRAAKRVRDELEKPEAAVGSRMNAKKLAKIREELETRLGLLTRYTELLEAAHSVMHSEVNTTRRTVLKRAVQAKRANDAAEEERQQAAIKIQRFRRGMRARKIRRTLQAAIAEKQRREKLAERAQKSRKAWNTLNTVLSGVSHARRRAVAATMLQRAARERRWQQQVIAESERAFAKTQQNMGMQRAHMSALRFGPQRVRLLDREDAYQKSVAGALLRVRRSRRSGGKIVETESERDMRLEIVASHAHRAARAAQEPAPLPEFAITGDVASIATDADADAAASLYMSRSSKPSTPRAYQRSTEPATAASAPRPPTSLSARPSTSASSRPPTSSSARPPTSARPTTRTPRSRHAIGPSDLTAVTRVAMRRQPWVQTSNARDFLEASAAEALRPSIERMEAQAAGTGLHAALLLARHACDRPPSRVPVAESVSRSEVFFNPRLNAPKSATARIASIWIDSSLPAAHAKEEHARYRKWRDERRAWIRSSGLRRRTLLQEEVRCDKLATKWDSEIDKLYQRMRQWQVEDDAVLVLQSAWRFAMLRKRQRVQMNVGLTLSLNSRRSEDSISEPAGSGQKAVSAAYKLRKRAQDRKAADNSTFAEAPEPAAEQTVDDASGGSPTPSETLEGLYAPSRAAKGGLDSVLLVAQGISLDLDAVMAPLQKYATAQVATPSRGQTTLTPAVLS